MYALRGCVDNFPKAPIVSTSHAAHLYFRDTLKLWTGLVTNWMTRPYANIRPLGLVCMCSRMTHIPPSQFLLNFFFLLASN